MSVCKVCAGPRSKFMMNNRVVCMHCDELLFDLEIECEAEETQSSDGALQRPQLIPKTVEKKRPYGRR